LPHLATRNWREIHPSSRGLSAPPLWVDDGIMACSQTPFRTTSGDTMSMIHESISIDPNELRARVVGDVHTPSDAGWDEARMAWNLAADQRPAVVLLAGSAQDVAEAVDFARAAGLRVGAQSTGHAAAARRWDEPTLLIKMERLRGVRIDPATRIARAEAGAQW
jgi:hypothetical protein